ncbi:hypothetical protein FOMG_19640 [Fusarium oxysporum f. sp. melonis 26406]|uniref:Sialidase domain-containing protein n=1 Tax=Fusarium oxysporum f. sp. melonis 26406 TaxID=1089452 RepID=W9YVM3_FUSOX|nr:hypothetical protein FOMG_19640 [Fusarium oxysporum f. sp. melonis 26406]
MSLSWIKPQWAVPNPISTDTGPSIASFNGKLHMLWKGSNGDEGIWHSAFDGSYWVAQENIKGIATAVIPKIAVYNGKLYAAWRGRDSDERLWYTSYDGSSWAPQQMIPSTWSSVGPSLATFNNRLYAIWKGMGSDETLWFTSFDGSSWLPQKQITSTWSSVGPAITSFKGTLYAFWKGMGADETIWYSSSTDGNKWAAQQVLPSVIRTRSGPSVAVFGTHLYIIWDTASGNIHYTCTGDGEHYGFGDHAEESLPTVMGTSRIPSIALHDGVLMVAWKGLESDKRIWWTKTSF